MTSAILTGASTPEPVLEWMLIGVMEVTGLTCQVLVTPRTDQKRHNLLTVTTQDIKAPV